MPATNPVVVNDIATRPYTPRAATASAGKCGSSAVPISEREAFTTSGIAKAAVTTIAPMALDKTIVHGGIDGPSPAGHRALPLSPSPQAFRKIFLLELIAGWETSVRGPGRTAAAPCSLSDGEVYQTGS